MTAREANKNAAKALKPRVGIITQIDLDRSAHVPLDTLIALLDRLTSKLLLITGGDYANLTYNVEIVKTTAIRRSSLLSKIVEQAVAHVRISHVLLKLRDQIDILIFFNGAGLTLPLIFARMMNIKCVVVLTNLGVAPAIKAIRDRRARGQNGELVRLRIQGILERLSYFFADELVVYAPSMIRDAGVLKRRNKTIVAHRHFVDFEECTVKDDVVRRDNVVGYVGRLSEEKGIVNLLEAIPQTLSVQGDVRFLIIGEGHLEEEIRNYVEKQALQDKVTISGWVPHEKLPEFFARMKLLVLPSYGEGLPNTMLEAMACGTPVLASRVGGIKDVIEDGKTGFLLESIEPTQIAKHIIRAISYQNLDQVSKDAGTYVKQKFTYAEALKEWSLIISGEPDY